MTGGRSAAIAEGKHHAMPGRFDTLSKACSALSFPIYLRRPPKPGAQERRLQVIFAP